MTDPGRTPPETLSYAPHRTNGAEAEWHVATGVSIAAAAAAYDSAYEHLRPVATKPTGLSGQPAGTEVPKVATPFQIKPIPLRRSHDSAERRPPEVESLPPHRAQLETVSPSAVHGYLHGDGRSLPPIAQDFRRLGFESIVADEQRDLSRRQLHVSTRGGDRRFPLGSGENPYTSIQSAVDSAPSGSVINVHRIGNDVFRERVAIDRSDITVRTDPSNPAVLEPGRGARGRANAGFAISSGVQNVAIKNFEIRNFSGVSAGIRVDGASIGNITIAGNHVHDASLAEGIAVYGRGSTEASALKGIKIISNNIHDLSLGQLETMPVNGNVSGFRIVGNSGRGLNNIFIDAIGGEGTSPSASLDRPRMGIIECNYADKISTSNNPAYDYYSSSAGIYIDGAKDSKVRYNYINDSDFGISVGSEHRGLNATGITVAGNLVEGANLEWMTRGGHKARPGGASHSTAFDNVLIGNGGLETQENVDLKTFMVGSNPYYTNASQVSLLPKPIADAYFARARNRR